MAELKYSCGCHVVEGELVAACTQVKQYGEVSADQVVLYSKECFRPKPVSAPASTLTTSEEDATTN